MVYEMRRGKGGGACKRCWRHSQCTNVCMPQSSLASTVQLISLLAVRVCGQYAVAITFAIMTSFSSWMCGKSSLAHVPALLGLLEM